MSQAAASMTYHIPKTTIWRRLQQEGKKAERSSNVKKQRLTTDTPVLQDNQVKVQEASNFSYCEVIYSLRIIKSFQHNIQNQKELLMDLRYAQVASEIPITYIDEDSIPEDSVIILTTEEMDELNLEGGRQIIVNSVCEVPIICDNFTNLNSGLIDSYCFYCCNLSLFSSGIRTGIYSMYDKYRR